MKIIYIDGSEREVDANEWEFTENNDSIIYIINRKYDKDGDYDEDEDTIVLSININQMRSIESN
jgi:hypothetical protein